MEDAINNFMYFKSFSPVPVKITSIHFMEPARFDYITGRIKVTTYNGIIPYIDEKRRL